ncbi:hypothetical protein BVU76_17280 [Mycolicibacterium porcinum]|nr:hypothetical protein BVU76_17280 [Mycolicibacterium porcinum]
MDVAVRPWLATGVAMIGATAVAMSPVTPSWQAPDVQVAAPAVALEFHLTDFELPYILTLPIVRQSIRNWAENWAVYLAGLGKAGIGLGQSVLAIPGVTVEIIQQILDLNFVGAFDTFTQAVRDSVVAVGQPLLDSAIWRNQKYLVVQAAMQAAWPQAVIDVANGLLEAGSGVATAFIDGTQNLVAAVLTFDLSNIVDATVEGTRNFLISLGDGARSIVDGIEAAQLGIATALATAPPPPPTFGASQLRSPSVTAPIGLDGPFKAVTVDVPGAVVKAESQPDLTAPANLVAEPQDSPNSKKKISPRAEVKDALKQAGADIKSLSDRVTADLSKHADGKKRVGVKVGANKGTKGSAADRKSTGGQSEHGEG